MKGPKYQRGFLGIASLAVSALSVGIGIKEGRDASKAGKAANEAQKKVNRLRNKQRKRQFLRNFRRAQADNFTSTVAAGIDLESSRTQGTGSSQQAQANTAMKEFDKFDELGVEIADQRQSAADSNFRSSVAGSIATFASQFISLSPKGSPNDGEQ